MANLLRRRHRQNAARHEAACESAQTGRRSAGRRGRLMPTSGRRLESWQFDARSPATWMPITTSSGGLDGRRAGGRRRQGRDGVAAARAGVDGRRSGPRRRWLRLNQRHGFDCPGCAWPEEHGGRKLAEFCENGAKAVAEEATKRVVTPEFFARHSIADLDRQTRVLAVAAGPAHPPDGAARRATTTTSRSTGTTPTG